MHAQYLVCSVWSDAIADLVGKADQQKKKINRVLVAKYPRSEIWRGEIRKKIAPRLKMRRGADFV